MRGGVLDALDGIRRDAAAAAADAPWLSTTDLHDLDRSLQAVATAADAHVDNTAFAAQTAATAAVITDTFGSRP